MRILPGLRAQRKRRALPATGDYQPDRIEDEWPDIMRFDVAGQGANDVIELG
jgi:hypothetical protein